MNDVWTSKDKKNNNVRWIQFKCKGRKNNAKAEPNDACKCM